jgi:ABC-type antimicrobial peptide transport system permease subunit
MRYGLKMSAVLSFFWIATALVISALIGIVFGVYPAWKAPA